MKLISNVYKNKFVSTLGIRGATGAFLRGGAGIFVIGRMR